MLRRKKHPVQSKREMAIERTEDRPLDRPDNMERSNAGERMWISSHTSETEAVETCERDPRIRSMADLPALKYQFMVVAFIAVDVRHSWC